MAVVAWGGVLWDERGAGRGEGGEGACGRNRGREGGMEFAEEAFVVDDPSLATEQKEGGGGAQKNKKYRLIGQ